MKKSKPIVKRVYDDVYRFELAFISNASFEEANKIIKKFRLPEMPYEIRSSSGAVERFTEEDFPKAVKGTIFVMWIRDKKDFYCLLHEVSHLVIMVFKDKGMDINNHVTEPFAYYLEFWFRKLWRIMNTK